MVLEDIQSESDGAAQSFIPYQIPDPRAIKRVAEYARRFDYDSYAHPLPIVGPLFGIQEETVRRMVGIHWLDASNTLKRPLTADEEDAFAVVVSRQMHYLSYAGPVGVMAGSYRAYNTRASWRLPFWKMGKDFDPSIVKLPRGRAILQGEVAKRFWQGLRYGLYSANGVVFSFLIFLSFTAQSGRASVRMDPRLKEYRETMMAELRQRMTGRNQEQPGQRPSQPRRDPTGQGSQSAGELWGSHRREIEGHRDTYDDASPSGGRGMQDDYQNYSSQNSMNTFPPEQSPQRTEDVSMPRTYSRQTRTQSPRSQAPPQQEPQVDFLNELDDASPVAAPPPGSPRRNPSSNNSAGNSWERLRKQASEGSSAQRNPSREPRPSQTDDYTFSSKEEIDQLAQSEAQKEFDARIERERRGGDFDEGRGGRRGW